MAGRQRRVSGYRGLEVAPRTWPAPTKELNWARGGPVPSSGESGANLTFDANWWPKPRRQTKGAMRPRQRDHESSFELPFCSPSENSTVADHSRDGGFGERRVCLRRGARWSCSPYCRTIAAAGSSRMPTPPRSSTKAHSGAMRRTTPSAVNIGVIHPPPSDARLALAAVFGLKSFRSQGLVCSA